MAQDKLPQATDSYFTAAKADLARRLAIQPITGKAKNVIILVGDGMSVATVTAARILKARSAASTASRTTCRSTPSPTSALVQDLQP